MKNHKLIFFTIPLLMMVLACQTILIPSNSNPQGESFDTQSPVLPNSSGVDENPASPSSSVIDQQTAIPSPTQSPTLAPSATIPVFTETPQATDLPFEVQLAIFDELWSIVDSEYLYPDFNGLDWNAIYSEFRNHIEASVSNAEFYALMDEMISQLGDDHSRFATPEEVRIENAEYEGKLDYVGVGILVTAIPEYNRAAIIAVFPGSPADMAGLRPRDSILYADGESILDENGALRDLVRGPEGTQVHLMLQSPGEDPRDVVLTRQRITGALPVVSTKFTTADGKQIGYIQIVTFADGTVDEQIRDALIDLTSGPGLSGLILDNRLNNGGASSVMTPILSYFTSGTLGYFVSRDGRYPLIIDDALDINGSQSFPLVVLIGHETVSFGEIFSGILKDLQRAYVIGEPTEGNIETLWGYDFSDGSRAWIAHDTFVPYNHPDENWELSGISPDLLIEGNWYDHTLENDPTIIAAINYLGNLSE